MISHLVEIMRNTLIIKMSHRSMRQFDQKNNIWESTRKQRIRTELKRIEWRIVKRIMAMLYHHNKMKKSHISTRGNLAYDNCRRYLEWMEMMELVRRENDEGFEVILLTEKAKTLYTEKLQTI
jgi:predicted transcriptional regulator